MKAKCKAVLNIKGEHFNCYMEAPHAGLAHANKDAEAIWMSDGEVRGAKRRQERGTATDSRRPLPPPIEAAP